MPELPEIETIRTGMEVNVGAKIISIDFKRDDIIKGQDYQPRAIINKAITDVRRRGKYLIFVVAKKYYLIFHLGMSGRFYMIRAEDKVLEPHVHVIIYLDNERRLLYQDARRFGGVWLTKDLELFFGHMGVEPLGENFSPEYLFNITRKRKIAIKSLLLNQQLIAGIGNIYADEALFNAGIRPDKCAGILTYEESRRLCTAVKEVLASSIKEQGTTFRDFRDSYNNSGNFQNFLQVYGKTNEKCPLCGTILIRQVIGGRSSHYCNNCQH